MTHTIALLQAAPDLNARLTALEAATKSAQSAGDNAWMLVSAALVLLMTGPGLALFYGGLVRRKNILSTMMHSFIMMGLITVIWALVGYSLVFSEGLPFIGGLKYVFLNNVGTDPERIDYAGTITVRAADLHALYPSCNVRDHNARADLRRLCGAHEIQRHVPVHHALGSHRLFPHGTHGLGQRRSAERLSGWKYSNLRLRRWHRGPHHIGRFRTGLCAVSRKAGRIPAGSDEAAQHGAQRHRRLFTMGWLVRIQRRERHRGQRARIERLRCHPLCRCRRRSGLDGRRVA